MEVHHHSHHPKKWKEYVTEFIMLFAAVTLGFFAENQREHLIEGNREKQYMQSLFEDLRKDTTILNSLVRYDTIQTGKLDTSNTLLINNTWDANAIKLLYRLNLKTAGGLRWNLSERTSAQLKNAGGMRLVENQELSNKISDYWVKSDNLKEYSNFVDELKFKAREKSYSIFDQKYYINVTTGTVADNAKLLTTDPLILTEFGNRLNHINNSLKNVLLVSVDRHFKRAVELLELLKKEYNLTDISNEASLTYTPTELIEPGLYNNISFVFGLTNEKNSDSSYVDLNSESWNVPLMLGGGYHFLQMDGKFLNTDNEEQGYNYHAIRASNNPGDNWDSAQDTFFRVDLGAIIITADAEINIAVNISEWFKTPNSWNLNNFNQMLMQNYEAQVMMYENGQNVFTLMSND